MPRDAFASLDAQLQKLQSSGRYPERFSDGPDGFSTFKQIKILERALMVASPEEFGKGSALAGKLLDRMHAAGNLPVVKSGEGVTRGQGKSWNQGTFGNFLRNQKVNPPEEAIEAIRATLIQLCEKTLSAKGRTNADIADLLALPYPAPSDCLKEVLGNLAPPPPQAFVCRGAYRSSFGRGFDTQPRASWPGPLKEAAVRILTELVDPAGARLVLVTGPHMSGKKTTLKYLCQSLGYGPLELKDGSRIPLLALALDELAPGEFVEQVYTFFRNGDPSGRTSRGDEGLTVSAKIEHIQRLTKLLPACVILADAAPLENDGVIRTLHQDHVAKIVESLMAGDARSKIVLTGPDQGGFKNINEEAIRRKLKEKRFPLSGNLQFDLETMKVTENQTLASRTVKGITAYLAGIAIGLANRRRSTGIGEIPIMQAVEVDNHWRILSLLWTHLLEPEERFVLGAVASSQDGLRLSVLVRMVKSLPGLGRSGPWVERLLKEGQIEAVIEELGELIQSRQAPLDAGQRSWGGPESEPLLFMDQGWRRNTLKIWFDDKDDKDKEDVALARDCSWLVAREAAEQARTFKLLGGLSNAKYAFARDVQAFNALIASVDPSCRIKPKPSRTSWSLEATILPPPGSAAAKPDGISTLRYAFLRWYKDYLEGENFRLLSEMDDPDLRLRLLLPLFEPSEPWSGERNLLPEIREYNHLRRAFTADELLDLLTAVAMASLRMQRFDLLGSVARLGEQILDRHGKDVDKFAALRLLRAEIDAGLYAGANPDDALLADPHRRAGKSISFLEIIRRINELLNGRFGPYQRRHPATVLAQGKLRARLGEACHMADQMRPAHRAFTAAMLAEQRMAALRGVGTCTGTVLGGRGARACLAYYVDVARRRAWANGQASVALPNGLVIPAPPLVPEDDRYLRKARDMYLMNSRRIGAFDVADRLGLRMDKARLAMVVGAYPEALEALKDVDALRLRPDANIEVSMELHALRCRAHLEALLILYRQDAAQSAGRKQDGPQDGAEAAARLAKQNDLLTQAEHSLASLQHLVSSRRALALPFGTLFRYLNVWLEVLKSGSGIPQSDRGIETLLRNLGLAMGHMDDAHFRRFAGEAQLLKRALEAYRS